MLVLSPKQGSLDDLTQAGVLKPFDGSVLAFLEELSKGLLHHPQKQNYPELAALGFWLRKGQLNSLKQSLLSTENVLRKPLGTVVHYTPANVDTMFIYSWVCSVLMGNSNLLRLSSRPSAVRDILLDELNRLFKQPEFEGISQTNLFVTFEHDAPVSREVSLLADARVIWGGDDSVTKIRSLPVKPRCRDIAFADRFSAALINTDVLQQESEYQELASKLWRDTQPYAQMACSSPRVIFAMGRHYQQACKKLATYMDKLFADVDADITRTTNHLVTTQLLQSQHSDSTVLHRRGVSILELAQYNREALDWHCGQAMFYLLSVQNLDDLLNFAEDKLQTLSYWGVEKQDLFKLLENESITGIDRVVPVGRALDFATLWDGYDLFSQLSRQIILE